VIFYVFYFKTCSSLTSNTASDRETWDTASNEPAVSVPLGSGGSNLSTSENTISNSAKSMCISIVFIDLYIKCYRIIWFLCFISEKKLDRSKDDQDFYDSVIVALRDPIKETDAVDGFLITLGEGLRKLPYKERSRMQIKFLSMINEKQDQMEYHDITR